MCKKLNAYKTFILQTLNSLVGLSFVIYTNLVYIFTLQGSNSIFTPPKPLILRLSYVQGCISFFQKLTLIHYLF